MVYIFIDDSGDDGFDFEKGGTSQYFILGAVLICDEHNRSSIENIAKSTLDNIINKHKVFYDSASAKEQKKYFSELKYENVNSKYFSQDELIDFCKELSKCTFELGFVIIDKISIKEKIDNLHVKTLIKLINEMDIDFKNCKIIHDRPGSGKGGDIKRDIEEYYDLDDCFEFRDSKDERLIQVSDLITGIVKSNCKENKIHGKNIICYDIITKDRKKYELLINNENKTELDLKKET